MPVVAPLVPPVFVPGVVAVEALTVSPVVVSTPPDAPEAGEVVAPEDTPAKVVPKVVLVIDVAPEGPVVEEEVRMVLLVMPVVVVVVMSSQVTEKIS